MKICSPHCGLSPQSNSGGETYEREILRHLAAEGLELHLILARHKPYPLGVANWTVHRLPIGRGLRWPVAALVLPHFIRKVCVERRCDLLRVHSLRYVGPAVLLARRGLPSRLPIVSHHHHLDPNPLNRLIEKRVIASSARVITGSHFSKRQLLDTLGLKRDNIEVVPYGVDERFVPGLPDMRLQRQYDLQGREVLLFLGGLKERKNLFFLLQVFQEVVRARGDKVCLLLAGDGPQRRALQAWVRRQGLERQVVFSGYVREEDKVRYFNLADLFVFPSRLEGFGLVVAEAMACGLPVVSSGAGALPELVPHGEVGFTADPQDLSTFGRHIVQLLDDQQLRQQFARAGRQRIEDQFRWRRSARLVKQVYEEVVSQARQDAAAAH